MVYSRYHSKVVWDYVWSCLPVMLYLVLLFIVQTWKQVICSLHDALLPQEWGRHAQSPSYWTEAWCYVLASLNALLPRERNWWRLKAEVNSEHLEVTKSRSLVRKWCCWRARPMTKCKHQAAATSHGWCPVKHMTCHNASFSSSAGIYKPSLWPGDLHP